MSQYISTSSAHRLLYSRRANKWSVFIFVFSGNSGKLSSTRTNVHHLKLWMRFPSIREVPPSSPALSPGYIVVRRVFSPLCRKPAMNSAMNSSSLDESYRNESTSDQHSELQSDPSKTYFLLPSSKEAEAQKVVQLLSGNSTASGQCAIRIHNASSEILTSLSDSNDSSDFSPETQSNEPNSTAESSMSPSSSDRSFNKPDGLSKIGTEANRRQSPRKTRCPSEWSDGQSNPKRPKTTGELGKSLKPNEKPTVETKSTKSMNKSMNKSVNNDVWDRIASGLNDATFWEPVRPADNAASGVDSSKHPVRPIGGLTSYGPFFKSSLLLNDKSRRRTTGSIAKSKSTGDIISNAAKQSAQQKLNSSFELPSTSAARLAGLISNRKVLKSRSSSDHNSSSSDQSTDQPPRTTNIENADKPLRDPTEQEIFEILDSEASLDRETKGRIFDKMNLLIKSKLEKAMNQFVEQMISTKNDILNSSLSASEESSEPTRTENVASPQPNSSGNDQPASSSQKENSPESPTAIPAKVRKITVAKPPVRTSPTRSRMRVVPTPRVIPCYETERLPNGNSVVRDSKTQRVIRVIKRDDTEK